MARAWGARPSSLLGLREPLAAYQFDSAVFALDEAIDAAIGRERRRLDMADLDRKERAKVEKAEKAMRAVIDRILGIAAERRAAARAKGARPVEYIWSEDRTQIVGFRYTDEAAA